MTYIASSKDYIVEIYTSTCTKFRISCKAFYRAQNKEGDVTILKGLKRTLSLYFPQRIEVFQTFGVAYITFMNPLVHETMK